MGSSKFWMWKGNEIVTDDSEISYLTIPLNHPQLLHLIKSLGI